jgi:hypothetical protein
LSRTSVVLLALVVLGTAGAWAEAPAAPAEAPAETGLHVAVSREPTGAVHQGELVRVFLDVGTETRFTIAPRFPELRLPDAIALVPDPLPAKLSRVIDGRPVQFIRNVVVVFPLRPGRREIPPLEIIAGGEVDGRPTGPVSLSTAALTVDVEAVPGAGAGVVLPATPRLTVEESFDPQPGQLRMGDAVTRTVTLEAERSLGLMLPDLAFAGPDGVAVYPDPPRIEDDANRGRYLGRRVESVTYVFERPGRKQLPELRIAWWNSEAERLEEAVLPARQVTVIPSLAQVVELGVELARTQGPFWIAAALLLWTVRTPAQRVLAAARRTVHEARRRSLEGEAHAFRAFRRACRRGDDDVMVRCFWRWRSRIDLTAPPAFETLRRTPGHENGILDRFARARYGPDPEATPTPREVGRAVRKLRRRLLAQRSSAPRMSGLNPGGSAASSAGSE